MLIKMTPAAATSSELCWATSSRYHDEVEELMAALRATPFHQWSRLCDQTAGSSRQAFDEACVRVRWEWTAADLCLEFRRSLTAAATAIALAMPEHSDVDESHTAHVHRALEALHAARDLARNGSLGSAYFC